VVQGGEPLRQEPTARAHCAEPFRHLLRPVHHDLAPAPKQGERRATAIGARLSRRRRAFLTGKDSPRRSPRAPRRSAARGHDR
jgi:hypothetical protein